MKEENSKSAFGTASLVLAIIAIAICLFPLANFMSYILGILAIIFGIISLVHKSSKGQAITGLVLAVVAVAITVLTNMVLMRVLSFVGAKAFDYIEDTYSYLRIDEEFPRTVTMDKYNQVEVGMSYEKVVELLGSEGMLAEESTLDNITTKSYRWIAENRISNATITFVNDQVAIKSQFLLDVAE